MPLPALQRSVLAAPGVPMRQKTTSQSGGIGFVGLLTILFIALKLTNHIDWSWTWVLSPLWISASIVAALLTVIVVLAILKERQK